MRRCYKVIADGDEYIVPMNPTNKGDIDKLKHIYPNLIVDIVRRRDLTQEQEKKVERNFE